jgi:hypothetical protein
MSRNATLFHRASRLWLLVGLVFIGASANARPAPDLFEKGVQAYRGGEYAVAVDAFRRSAEVAPAPGTLLNLGLSEWQRGGVGPAVLAWEQARWLNPFGHQAAENLRFARKVAQLESPDLAWYEVVSTWLPVNSWAWIAGLSLWSAVAIGILPGIFRLRRAVWHQAMAALGLAIFLLSVPAHLGVSSRARIGFVLDKDTPLKLTPTADAQWVTRLGAGEPARVERVRGNHILIRTSRGLGWIDRHSFGTISTRL